MYAIVLEIILVSSLFTPVLKKNQSSEASETCFLEDFIMFVISLTKYEGSLVLFLNPSLYVADNVVKLPTAGKGFPIVTQPKD